MSDTPSPPGVPGNGLAMLLSASASAPSSPDSIRELSRLLNVHVLGDIYRLVREKTSIHQLDLADSMLMSVERAARLAGRDEIRFWARIGRGQVAVMRQDEARAEPLIREGFEYFDSSPDFRERPLLDVYAQAGDWLCDRALAERQVSEARKILTRMLRRVGGRGADDLEIRIAAKLLSLSLSIDDLEVAEQHALNLIAREVGDTAGKDDQFQETLYSLLRTTASRLYEAGETKYGSARRIARAVLDEAGVDGPMLLLLATAAFTQEDFADSLVWLDRLLEAPEELVPEYDVSRLYHRRALCLVYLDRTQEALESIQEAVRVAPADPFVRFAAAQVVESLGMDQEALIEYAETVRLANARLASATPVDPSFPGPRSATEYRSNLPVEDLRDFAILRRALLLRRTGSTLDAVGELQNLVSIGDETSRREALRRLAEWAEEDDRLEEAAELLSRARSLPSGPSDEAELQYAAVLISLKAFDQALDVLAPLSHKSRKPEECVALLGRMPEGWAGLAKVLKVRGYAKTEAGWPSEGFEDLNEAVKADPSDAEALFLRALARITFGIQPGQEVWNQSRTLRHIAESLEDLYAALRLKPDHEEARRVLQWLVERAASNAEMYEILSAGGTREGDLFTVFPGIQAAFEAAWRANSLGHQRKFAEATQAWIEAMRTYQHEGFEILAARTNIRLADAYLRLLDLDNVAASLERAERLRFLVNTPLSREVLDQYNELAANRGLYQQPTLGREVEYVWIYDHTAYDQMMLTFIKANFQHRLGDVAGALAHVRLLEPVLAEAPQNLGRVFGLEEVLWVVAILRDAGQYDEALRMLEAVQPFAAEMNRSLDVFYMRGLIYDHQGVPGLASEAYEQAIEAVEETSRHPGVAPYIQHAASLLQAGRHAEALQALERIDIDQEASSDRDRLIYQTVAAWVYEAAARYDEARDAVEKAIAIVEGRRAEVPDLASRRAWQGQQENLFSIAVKVYAEIGRPDQAWRTVELSKARTLLDEFAGREMLSPEYAQLINDLESIDRAIQVADREINRSPTGDQASALRAEALAELSELLGAQFQDMLTSTPFTEGDFPALKSELHERREIVVGKERQMRDAASIPAGDVITLGEVAELLKEQP